MRFDESLVDCHRTGNPFRDNDLAIMKRTVSVSPPSPTESGKNGSQDAAACVSLSFLTMSNSSAPQP
jgi:hypothetical protein